ncbi:MAG: lysoplasmalogenase [Hyphomonadaceae bacterium]
MGELAIGPAFWALMALSAASAAAYGFYYLQRERTLVRAAVKTIFMSAAAGALVSVGAPFPLVAAIAFSALGDLFLAFKSKWTLPLGILAFLIAQLIYIVIFTAIWFFSGDNSPLLPRYIAMGAVIAAAIVFLIWMAPKLGWMALGVVPYAVAITGMGVAAMWLPWVGWPATLGALLFLVSDFVLATELFRLPADAPVRRITAPVVWWTYVAAQALIILGVINIIQAGG